MSRLKCIVLDDYQGAAKADGSWKRLGDSVDLVFMSHHVEHDGELISALRDANMVVVMRERTPLPAHILEQLPELKLIVTSGMRNTSIDQAAAAARGIVVCGTASESAPPAELTWALLLALARHLGEERDAMRSNGPWQSSVGADLEGRTLGILGLGKIGKRVCRVAKAFGMQVLAWSPNLDEKRAAAEGAILASSKEVLFAESDFVTLHLVLSERTRGIVGRPELAAMQPHALLVNTSRAGLVDREALLDALMTRSIAGAALDVHDHEPLPADDPFRVLPNVLASPHLGYVTQRNYAAYFGQAVEDIEAWLAGTPIRVLNN
ncbi:phosphoglycerate dehydrogenase [Xanthomonas bromi]|uniref:Hydroxyacid dehydrogenase n=1 Tax=Xanthomonas bromi TaxID=56449 RepID=A0A1C3NR75_9XANT|nr:D-2-hydroxyacid dehydrogenase family protein [Xanthomonas bromi]PPV05192.1 hydroxyacid dehydrogenase [Xanthomonas bromi]SBV52881.1 phosphoglycerate dehydrogenase [Xanthomonas bromi]